VYVNSGVFFMKVQSNLEEERIWSEIFNGEAEFLIEKNTAKGFSLKVQRLVMEDS
jgi:hypothetical protein